MSQSSFWFEQPALAILLVVGSLWASPAVADDPSGSERPPTTPVAATDVAEIRRKHASAAFAEISAYIEANPQAGDVAEGYRFLFETATEFDLTRESKPLAIRFLKDFPAAPLSDRSHARRIAIQALALEGETEAALDLFGEELVSLRRLDPEPAIATATMLASAMQRGGHPADARRVYERLQRSFLLNARVDSIATNRLARLELLGQPAPPVGLTDLDGQPANLDTMTGKIVLIDFWATNCPPCIEELPQLRQTAADYEQRGFSILAVSLDEEEADVQRFLDRTPLPWRVCLSSADDDATRNAYRVETIPANFLIGVDGTVAGIDLHGADLTAVLERLLAEGK